MKSKVLSLFQVALIATLPPSLGTAFSQNYQVINLGTPLGGSFALAAGISDGGFLGGYANLPNNTTQHAIIWLPGSTKDLGTFGGTNSALLNQFAGFAETATPDSLGQDFCGTGTHLVCLPLAARFRNCKVPPGAWWSKRHCLWQQHPGGGGGDCADLRERRRLSCRW